MAKPNVPTSRDLWVLEKPEKYTITLFLGRGQYDRTILDCANGVTEQDALAEAKNIANRHAGRTLFPRAALVYAVRETAQHLLATVKPDNIKRRVVE